MPVQRAICYVRSGAPTVTCTGRAVWKLRPRRVGTRMIAGTLLYI